MFEIAPTGFRKQTAWSHQKIRHWRSVSTKGITTNCWLWERRKQSLRSNNKRAIPSWYYCCNLLRWHQKKLQLNRIKKHLSKTAVKLKDCIVQPRDDANVWRKMAIVSKSWEIDCTTASRFLMDRMHSLYSGQKGKSKLQIVV